MESIQSQKNDQEGLALLTLYAVFLTLILGQASLFCWRRFHRRSFELVTLIGLWLLPSFFSLQLHFWRFLTVWGLYSVVTAYLLLLCLSKTLSSMTPRKVTSHSFAWKECGVQVYTWFFLVYRISVVVGICGYTALLIELFGLAPLFVMLGVGDVPIILLWYGLYFGILGRDCAEVASDWMQSGVMGGRRRLSVQVNKCAICQKDLKDTPGVEEENTEKTIQLNCKHLFHEFCIRGWTLIGKKDICPTCGEKVDLKTLYSNRPWETSNLTWIKMLDAVRYLIVWNPLIFLILQFIMHLAGIEPENPHPTRID